MFCFRGMNRTHNFSLAIFLTVNQKAVGERALGLDNKTRSGPESEHITQKYQLLLVRAALMAQRLGLEIRFGLYWAALWLPHVAGLAGRAACSFFHFFPVPLKRNETNLNHLACVRGHTKCPKIMAQKQGQVMVQCALCWSFLVLSGGRQARWLFWCGGDGAYTQCGSVCVTYTPCLPWWTKPA